MSLDTSKLILKIVGVISNFGSGLSALVSPIVTLIENGCIFLAANTIKNYRDGEY